jgi:yecA family protein
MKHELSYRDIQDIVLDLSDSGSAAEAHGLLAGLLCMDAGIDVESWLEQILGPDEPSPSGRDRALLVRLFEETRRQLNDFDFSFELFLPDDDQPLSERADALGEWCQGFLLGLGYGSKGADWPGECAEILRDFVEISRLDPEVSGEADEAAYAELAEYVRVGVQVIRSELQSRTPKRLH